MTFLGTPSYTPDGGWRAPTTSQTPRTGNATRTLATLIGFSLVVLSCDRDPVAPERATLRPPNAPGHTLTYPHTNNGGCYVWGQDNPQYPPSGNPPPLVPWAIGRMGTNAQATACGVTVGFTPLEYVNGTYLHIDTVYVWYAVMQNADATQSVGTNWKTGPYKILGNGMPWYPNSFPAGLVYALQAQFSRPVKSVTARFRCPIVSGFQLEALASDFASLQKTAVPTVTASGGSSPCGAYPGSYSDVTITVADPPYIASVIAVGPPRSALSDDSWANYVGVEYWIVPDSSSRLQLSVTGSPGGSNPWVGDSVLYTASATDGSTPTITSWKWTADANTSPPPGMTERRAVSACNTNGKKPLTCPHTPLTSGTVTVYGTINKKADSAKRHLNVTMPKIGVACGPPVGADPAHGIGPSPGVGIPVTRGGIVLCNARAYFRSLILTGWTFTADDPALGTVRGNTGTSQDWTGPAVASGKVSVQGKVNGVTAISDTGRFTVQPGDTLLFPMDTAKAATGEIDYFSRPAYEATILGWVRVPGRPDINIFDKPPLDPNPRRIDTTGARIDSVRGGGPNSTLWYVSSLSTKAYLRAQIMKDLRTDAASYLVNSDDFVGMGCQVLIGTTAMKTLLEANSVCKQSAAGQNMVNYTRRHESCHMAHHADVLTKNDTTHARLDSIQRLVSTDSVTVRTTMTRLLRLMNDAALDYSSLIDVQPNILTPPPAQFDVWTPQAPGTTGYWQLYTWPVWGTIEPSRLCP